jgi:hypothetical protein
MKITTRLTEGDVIRFNFYLYYRRWVIRIVTAVMILDVLIIIFYSDAVRDSMWGSLWFPALFLILLPAMVYVNAMRGFKNNRRLSEQIAYAFTESDLNITGESFTATMSWDKIYKVTKTKRWLLIWHSKNSANIIPLKDIWDGDILYLKEILLKKGVSNNL